MRILVVDNYDSFTWNLVHLFEERGAEVDVFRNDAISVGEAEALVEGLALQIRNECGGAGALRHLLLEGGVLRLKYRLILAAQLRSGVEALLLQSHGGQAQIPR